MNWQEDDLLFDVATPLGFRVHCTREYWLRKVVVQHPVMVDRVEDVKQTLATPDEIRASRSDKQVYLFTQKMISALSVWLPAKQMAMDF